MPFFFFHWTEDIVEHLLLHDVSREEFEAVVTDDGRLLFCVFKWADADHTEIEPVTAFELQD